MKENKAKAGVALQHPQDYLHTIKLQYRITDNARHFPKAHLQFTDSNAVLWEKIHNYRQLYREIPSITTGFEGAYAAAARTSQCVLPST